MEHDLSHIEEMTLEEFFEAMTDIRSGLDKSEIHIWRACPREGDDPGGWRVNSRGGVAYGDTIGLAIRAAYDHVNRLPSQHVRRVVHIFGVRYGYTWLSYDYRAKDALIPELGDVPAPEDSG